MSYSDTDLTPEEQQLAIEVEAIAKAKLKELFNEKTGPRPRLCRAS